MAADTKLVAIFEKAAWLRSDGKAAHLPISGMGEGHQVTWPELAAMLDQLHVYRYALEHIAMHAPGTPGLHFETLEQLIASAVGIAKIATYEQAAQDK